MKESEKKKLQELHNALLDSIKAINNPRTKITVSGDSKFYQNTIRINSFIVISELDDLQNIIKDIEVQLRQILN